jgi:hypothetical protein
VKLRKTVVTIETEQFMVIRRRRVIRSWCSECGREAEFVPRQSVGPWLDERPNQAGFRAIGRGPHYATAADGSVVVCVRSLMGS